MAGPEVLVVAVLLVAQALVARLPPAPLRLVVPLLVARLPPAALRVLPQAARRAVVLPVRLLLHP